MFIKGRLNKGFNIILRDVNVEISEDLNHGTMFNEDIGKLYNVDTITDELNRMVYYIKPYNCSVDLGCKFKIIDIVGE